MLSLSLFVENVLLGIEEVEKKLTPVVLEHTRQLGKVSPDLPDIDLCLLLSNSVHLSSLFDLCAFFHVKILEKSSDLKSRQAFEQVIALLISCKERAVECIFR